VTASLKDYQEARDFLEKEHPAWLRAMSPRRINVGSTELAETVLNSPARAPASERTGKEGISSLNRTGQNER
jgi:hypothetical protein